MTVDTKGVASPVRGRTSEWAFALLVATIAFVAYARTMFPDMLVEGGGDAPKFQYLGRLLGTAHNPGYPLYILVSHLFSYLPIGTVAYRMNLLSGLAAALAVAAMYFVIRRLDCTRSVAVLTSLAFAFGQVYWQQAIVAEVYGLAALLLASFTAVLFWWGRAAPASDGATGAGSRRWRDLMIAIGISALALGHHLTIALIAPGAVAYALLVDRRQALRWKTIVGGMLLVLCGLAQYGFIIIRTLQHAAHVESHAASLGELVAVIRGTQFQSEYFAYGLNEIVNGRAVMIAALGSREVGGTLGVLLIVVGIVAMARRCRSELVFLLLGIAFDVIFAATYGAPDTPVFLLPAFVLCWPIAACGLEALLSLAHAKWRAAAIIAAALLLPGRQLYGNYSVNDHHLRYVEGRELRMILAQIPDHSAIVGESYTLDAAITYALEVEHIGHGKRIVQIRDDVAEVRTALASGLNVYAFERSRSLLESWGGLDFVRVPLVVREGQAMKDSDRAMFRVSNARLCSNVGNTGWMDVTEIARRSAGRLSIKIDNYRPFDSKTVLYAESSGPLTPVLSKTGGNGEPRLEVGPFADAAEIGALSRAMALASKALPPAGTGAANASRIEVDVNDQGEFSSFVLSIGGPFVRVWVNAVVDRDSPRRAMVCEEPPNDSARHGQGGTGAR